MRQVVPSLRVPPTAGKTPERMAQNLEYSSGLSVNLTGTYVVNALRHSSIFEMLARNSSAVDAFVSVRIAVSPSPVVSLTEASDFLSSSSALFTIHCPLSSTSFFMATTALHASLMSLK